jgi:hypothetical protein
MAQHGDQSRGDASMKKKKADEYSASAASMYAFLHF